MNHKKVNCCMTIKPMPIIFEKVPYDLSHLKMPWLILFISGILVFTAEGLLAGAWVQEKGKYYTKTTLAFSDADEVYDADGNTDGGSTYKETSMYLYIEYGLFSRTSLIIAPLLYKNIDVESGDWEDDTKGIFGGDAEIQVKYQVLDAPIVLSVLGGLKIPMDYDEDDPPAPGTGEVDYDVKLLLGRSFYPFPAYASMDIGYCFRGGETLDEIKINAEAGANVNKHLMIRLLAYYLNSSEDGEQTDLSTGMSEEGQKQTRLGGGFIYFVNEKIDIDVSFLKTVSGENVNKSFETFIGFALKF